MRCPCFWLMWFSFAARVKAAVKGLGWWGYETLGGMAILWQLFSSQVVRTRGPMDEALWSKVIDETWASNPWWFESTLVRFPCRTVLQTNHRNYWPSSSPSGIVGWALPGTSSRHVTKQILIRGLVVAHLINFNIIKPIIIVQRSQPQNFHFFLAFLWH